VLTESIFREAAPFTELAFGRLIEWLDAGVPSGGERYVEMRQRLVSYFDRRDCPDPDELADETFNRIARTLEQDGVIRINPPARYCYVVAKFVLLEDYRRQQKRAPLDEAAPSDPSWRYGRSRDRRSGEPAADERRFECFDRCLDRLEPTQRELVIDYYRDAGRDKIERRRRIAGRLGITMNALGIRVWRIRESLTACMERCGFHRRADSGAQSGKVTWQ
jgi:DNA-directed RNA polymerase specialized sigma24 family protein